MFEVPEAAAARRATLAVAAVRTVILTENHSESPASGLRRRIQPQDVVRQAHQRPLAFYFLNSS